MAVDTDHGRERERMLGILGGMGPLATADFYAKLIAATPATRDQDHIPVVIVADPRVPDRATAYCDGLERDVLSALELGVHRLEAAGAGAIAVPCNTAHHWVSRLAACTPLPFLTITDAVLAALRARFPAGTEVLVLGTRATVAADVHGVALRAGGYLPIALEPAGQAQVDAVIADVKSGAVARARARFARVLTEIRTPGRAVLLACTELPVAVGDASAEDASVVDSTQALAAACVAWARRGTASEFRRSACVPS